MDDFRKWKKRISKVKFEKSDKCGPFDLGKKTKKTCWAVCFDV